MASDYFTITPEMKAPEEMAAAAGGNFAPFQVRVVDMDGSFVHLQQQKVYLDLIVDFRYLLSGMLCVALV